MNYKQALAKLQWGRLVGAYHDDGICVCLTLLSRVCDGFRSDRGRVKGTESMQFAVSLKS